MDGEPVLPARSKWAKEFEDWLKQPHQDDVMIQSDEDDEAEDSSTRKKARNT